jgi:hypothetical protein
VVKTAVFQLSCPWFAGTQDLNAANMKNRLRIVSLLSFAGHQHIDEIGLKRPGSCPLHPGRVFIAQNHLY